jgi:hypothetical protein
MNWYKLTKLAVEILDAREQHVDYLDIAHGNESKFSPHEDPQKQYLWVWEGNRLSVIKKPNNYQIHNTFWDCDIHRTHYAGRASQTKDGTIISVYIPFGLIPSHLKSEQIPLSIFRELPEELVSALLNRFGENSKIYTFY